MARILLVDDEATVLQSLGMILKSEGHSIVSLTDSREALHTLETQSFDLLVTDIRMTPVDGMELLKAAKKKDDGMKAMVVSAFTSDEIMEQAKAAGCAEYIMKPFKVDDVMAAVKRILEA